MEKFIYEPIVKFIKKFLTLLIKFYQVLISPIISYNACRFHPSCSQYMIDALEKKGIFKGLMLGTWRLLRCHPWSSGGNDEVK